MVTATLVAPCAHREDDPSPSALWRVRAAVVCLLLTVLSFVQAEGRTVADTKLDLTVDPIGFLARALRLWDPEGFGGQVQNQAAGYLFPTGPFFALGHVAGLPSWVVQRLWWALLLCTAFLGVVRLARAAGIGTPGAQLVAGLAYALSPRVVSTIGPISVEVLPFCLAPWVLVPLVAGGRSPRRAAALSALAALCMGGVNAAATVGALVPAAVWLAVQLLARRRREDVALLGCWAAATALATAWWTVPLVLLGRYGAPFLPYSEPASVTTSVTSLFETVRGTSHWVPFLLGRDGPLGRPGGSSSPTAGWSWRRRSWSRSAWAGFAAATSPTVRPSCRCS